MKWQDKIYESFLVSEEAEFGAGLEPKVQVRIKNKKEFLRRKRGRRKDDHSGGGEEFPKRTPKEEVHPDKKTKKRTQQPGAFGSGIFDWYEEPRQQITLENIYDLNPKKPKPKVRRGDVRSKLSPKGQAVWDRAQARKKRKKA